jgi:hypothetical protein
MAMGMIRKPLVSMDKKYIRDQATPDFVSFQDLFRKVYWLIFDGNIAAHLLVFFACTGC